MDIPTLVALSADVVWLAVILRLSAVVSPIGAGLISVTTAYRISFGGQNGYVPVVFEKKSQRTKAPTRGILITFLIGLPFLLPFPSWAKLVWSSPARHS
jgi:amino acid transporter